jgi:hypothetical protein
MESLQKINNKIIGSFQKNEPFSLIRVGNTEGYFIQSIHNKIEPKAEFFNWLYATAGVWPVDMNFLSGPWYDVNIQGMKNADYLGFVDISGEINRDHNFMNNFKGEKFSGLEQIEILDPGLLLNKDKIIDPWTKSLKDKKVLVVSSHKNTIEHQWNRIDSVWMDHKEKIVPFDLIGVVRSPFNPFVDDRQYPNCNSWYDSLQAMKKEIDNYDYDVLLVGAGAYSPALADHAKRNNKIGITLCGAIQIFFGILGSRWVVNQHHYSFWNSLYNEYWTYPLESDLPTNKNNFEIFEKAYW